MMGALSLRTWRRNGVACDELLFFPDSTHSQQTASDPNSPQTPPRRTVHQSDAAAGFQLTNVATPNSPLTTTRSRTRTLSHDSSLSSLHELANSWDTEEDDATDPSERDDVLEPLQDESLIGPNDPSSLLELHRIESSRPRHRHTRLDSFRENHPRITRFGSFFFFRTSNTTVQNAVYAPSGPSVMGAALDLSMPILFNFHLFIEAYNHVKEYGSEVPAKILPLIFLSVLIVRSMIPPGRRGRFWKTMKYTVLSPFHKVSFRDAYIGDILTSLVRPLQDILFALAYYVTVIWGTVTSRYGLSESGDILESSWLLHNVILPSVALLPLWCKFLQVLRECYDTKKRWPHLGNAFKYLSAALVVLYGMTHPENRRSPYWILAFVAAWIYQVVWDVVVDWELFVIAPRDSDSLDVSETSWFTSHISSVPPDSTWLLGFQRCWSPLCEFLRTNCGRIPRLSQIQLRPRRLYKTEVFYWRIFYYNLVFRFCWMLSFIPAYHLSPSGQVVIPTFSSDTKSYVGVLLPVAEIFRRTCWGFLYLEMKTIRMSEGDPSFHPYTPVDNRDESEISSNSVHSNAKPNMFLPTWLGMQQQLQFDAATSRSPWKLSNCFQYSEATRDKLFVAELSIWAVAFVGLGMWAST